MFKKIFAIFACIFMVFSCGSTSSKGGEKVLNLNFNEEGKTIDPALSTDVSTGDLHAFLSEGLTRIDPKTKQPVPGLAEKYEVSSDGLTYTFHLRDGLKWSNGEPITANDFKFAWTRALDPKTAAGYAYMLYPIENAEEFNSGKIGADKLGINVLDDKTLVVKLKSVTPYFLSLTAFITYSPVNEKFIKEVGSQFALEADKIISSGPFKIESWTHNSEMKLVKNENYYNKDAIKIDAVNIKYIADSAASLNAFKNEEVDFVSLTAEQYEQYKNDPQLNSILMATTWYLEFNNNHKFLSNKNVRKAIAMAINKEEMCSTIFNGINEPAYTFTPKGVGMPGLKTNDFATEIGVSAPKYNLEEAKKLLAEGLKELGMSSAPEISIILNDSGTNKKVGEAVQEYLRVGLGINLKIETMAFKERLARMDSGNFDIVLAGWGADYQDPTTFLDLLETTNGNNYGKFSNAEYDKLIKLSRVTPDKEKRYEMLKRAEEIIADEAPVALLFQVKRNYLVNSKLSNYTFLAIGVSYNWNYTEIK